MNRMKKYLISVFFLLAIFACAVQTYSKNMWSDNGIGFMGIYPDESGQSAFNRGDAFSNSGGWKISDLFFGSVGEKEMTLMQNSLVISAGFSNAAPTDIALSKSSVDENSPLGSEIGQFSTADPDSADSFTYSLVAGEGDTDNNSFMISGNKLLVNTSLNFETKNNYSIRIQTKDNGNNTLSKSINIIVIDINEAPTDIILYFMNQIYLFVNAPVGTVIGYLTSKDEDPGETFTYSIAPGSPDADKFAIDGNYLVVKSPDIGPDRFDLDIRSTDSHGNVLQKQFTLYAKWAIYGIDLSRSDIDENSPVGSVLGILSCQSNLYINEGDYVYTLVGGDQNVDNKNFTISGNKLIVNFIPDFELKSTYTVGVQVTAQGYRYEQYFTIRINNLVEVGTTGGLTMDKIRIYPEPTQSGILKIEGLPKNRLNRISVFNLQGGLIVSKSSQLLIDEIDLRGHDSGIYLLKVNDQTFKVFK